MISSTERQRNAAMIKRILPARKRFMMDIVCNSRTSIDVDKFDYLLRDAYFCGSSSTPTPHRLIDNCRVIGDELVRQGGRARRACGAVQRLTTARARVTQ